MATLALNTFKTITANVTNSPQDIYTCPIGFTGIILLAQISCTDSQNDGIVSFAHVRKNVVTYLVLNGDVPLNDSLSALSGRLVLQGNEGDRIRVVGGTISPNTMPPILTGQNDSGTMQIVLSVVESANG